MRVVALIGFIILIWGLCLAAIVLADRFIERKTFVEELEEPKLGLKDLQGSARLQTVPRSAARTPSEGTAELLDLYRAYQGRRRSWFDDLYDHDPEERLRMEAEMDAQEREALEQIMAENEQNRPTSGVDRVAMINPPSDPALAKFTAPGSGKPVEDPFAGPAQKLDA